MLEADAALMRLLDRLADGSDPPVFLHAAAEGKAAGARHAAGAETLAAVGADYREAVVGAIIMACDAAIGRSELSEPWPGERRDAARRLGFGACRASIGGFSRFPRGFRPQGTDAIPAALGVSTRCRKGAPATFY